MHITPNNKLSNHFRKKKTEEVVYTFTEDYDYQIITHPNDPIVYPSINKSLSISQHLTFSDYGNNNTPDLALSFGGDVRSLGNVENFAIGDSINDTLQHLTNNGIWWNGTNPMNWDSDGDGISDYDEIYNWYTYEKIEAEYYFDNSVVFSKTYFISSDNSAIHLEDKSMAIPIMMATPSWMIMVM